MKKKMLLKLACESVNEADGLIFSGESTYYAKATALYARASTLLLLANSPGLKKLDDEELNAMKEELVADRD